MKIWLLLVNHKFQAMGNRFDVDSTSDDDNINTLKTKVKKEKPEALSRTHVDPSDLTVWKTKGEMVINESNFERLAEILGSINVNNKDAIEKLSELKRVANLGLSRDQTLLVQLPDPKVITIVGDDDSEAVITKIWLLLVDHMFQAIGNCFSFRTSSREDIGDLMEKVKEKKPEALSRIHVDPSDLTVWKTKGPMMINHSNSNSLAEILRKINFDDKDAIEKLRSHEQVVNLGLSDGQTLLVQLPVTNIYETESGRCKAVIPLLEKLLDIPLTANPRSGKDFEPDAIATETIMDATYGEQEAVICHVEFKNEFGIGGDCGVQNALGLCKHLALEEYKEIRNASCCPCITVSVVGPYISIGGAILADVFTVESFTGYIYLGRNPYTQGLIIRRAWLFATVAEAFHNLKRFYQNLELKDTPQLSRLFPNPTYIANKMPQPSLTFSSRFTYEGRESDDYQRDAHRLVAGAHYAPELFFCKSIQGRVTMVIMKFIASQDAYYCFKNVDLPSAILDDVKLAVRVLHDAGLVFGDLRRLNIIINTMNGRDRALLIDFEWVGLDGQAQYPANLNNSGLFAHFDFLTFPLTFPGFPSFILSRRRLTAEIPP
ncbi:hypothetical protein H4582DRAFT_2184736 [Lactarius indigo]|nr:hypothetical protein H4582DRAFT_2184736 [Lactarius indigo]